MRKERVGFALCGSFCTHGKVLRELEKLCKEYETVQPIVSEICLHTNTRFGTAEEFISAVEKITGHTVMGSVNEAEPIGPKKLLDVLVIAPCTGNTIGKLACGITDTAVTMAAKAHLRNGRPLVLALATNDGLAASAPNVGTMLGRKGVFFVPFRQDDCYEKPTSLVSDFSLTGDTLALAMQGKQYQPLLLGAK